MENPETYETDHPVSVEIWEKSILKVFPEGPKPNALLNRYCKGGLVLYYTKPVMGLIAIGISWILVGLIVIYYTVKLNTDEKVEPIPLNLAHIFFWTYVVVIFLGFICFAYLTKSTVLYKPPVQVSFEDS